MINYNDMYYVYGSNMPVYSTTSVISWNGSGSWSFYEPAKVVTYVPYVPYVPCSVTSVKKGKGAKLK